VLFRSSHSLPPAQRSSANNAGHYTGDSRKSGALVSSPMHNRTHKGGAVLWFLRKHSPMPAPFETTTIAEPSIAEGGEMASITSGRKSTAAQEVSHAAGPAHLQAKFLHQTLLAIGVEMDEGRAEDCSSVKPKSARHRDELRRCFAAHSDIECIQLRRRVANREAEIQSLRLQVQQVERMVQATRLAAARRSVRLRGGGGADGGVTNTLALTQGLLRSKNRLLEVADNMVWDADGGAMRQSGSIAKQKETTKEMSFEDGLQAEINLQFDAEQALRVSLEEQIRSFDRQTIQRKASEAGLFGTHAEILRMRSQALRMEARVTKLANELRRVYKQLPAVVQQKLAQSVPQWEGEKNKELKAIQAKHCLHHLKWLSSEELQVHISISENAIRQTREQSLKFEEVLVQGQKVLKCAFKKMQAAAMALASLREAWNALSARTTMGGLRASKDAKTALSSDNVQSRIEEASILVNVMLEYVRLMLPEAELSGHQQQEQEQQPTRMIHCRFQTKPKLDYFGAVKSNNR